MPSGHATLPLRAVPIPAPRSLIAGELLGGMSYIATQWPRVRSSDSDSDTTLRGNSFASSTPIVVVKRPPVILTIFCLHSSAERAFWEWPSLVFLSGYSSVGFSQLLALAVGGIDH